MARNGAGGYSRITPGTPYVNATTIDETVVNNEMDDLGNEIANSLAKDGQTVPTANLPMGGFKHTGVADSTARNHYTTTGQVQDNSTCTANAGGTANAITLALAPALTAYVKGQQFTFIASYSNTGAATLNINGLGAKNINRDASNPLNAGDISNALAARVVYDGTNFQLTNPQTGKALSGLISASGLTIAGNKLAGGTSGTTTVGAVGDVAIGNGLTLTGATLAVSAGPGLTFSGISLAIPTTSIFPAAMFSFTGGTKNADLLSNTTATSHSNDTAGNYFEYVLTFSGLAYNLSLSAGPGGASNFVVVAGCSIGSYEVISITTTAITLRCYHGNNAYDTFTEAINGVLYLKQ